MRPIYLFDEDLDAADIDEREAMERSGDLTYGRYRKDKLHARDKSELEELLDRNDTELDEATEAEILDLIEAFRDE